MEVKYTLFKYILTSQLNSWSWEAANHLGCRVFSILTQPTCSCIPANCSTESVCVSVCVCLKESFSVWERCRGDQRTNTSTRLVCALGKCLHRTPFNPALALGIRERHHSFCRCTVAFSCPLPIFNGCAFLPKHAKCVSTGQQETNFSLFIELQVKNKKPKPTTTTTHTHVQICSSVRLRRLGWSLGKISTGPGKLCYLFKIL